MGKASGQVAKQQNVRVRCTIDGCGRILSGTAVELMQEVEKHSHDHPGQTPTYKKA